MGGERAQLEKRGRRRKGLRIRWRPNPREGGSEGEEETFNRRSPD